MVKKMGLTPKQKAFADYYIECGNATEAARKAGYGGNTKTLQAISSENLSKPIISAYIAERIKPTEEKRIATADEVMQFYTAVMLGEVKDQFGLEASLSDRLKACDSLMKRVAAVGDKNKNAIEKLDNLLKEFKDAVSTEAER